MFFFLLLSFEPNLIRLKLMAVPSNAPLFSASERLHDVASRGPTDRKSRHYPKSALQKLLSMVEPIMRPLTSDLFEGDKEEVGYIWKFVLIMETEIYL